MHDPAHGNEFFPFLVDVLLVDLICADQNVFLVANANDSFEIFSTHDLSRGIAGVDDDDGARTKTIVCCLINFFLKSFNI